VLRGEPIEHLEHLKTRVDDLPEHAQVHRLLACGGIHP
jgi:hypothetical protein